MNSDKNFQR